MCIWRSDYRPEHFTSMLEEDHVPFKLRHSKVFTKAKDPWDDEPTPHQEAETHSGKEKAGKEKVRKKNRRRKKQPRRVNRRQRAFAAH